MKHENENAANLQTGFDRREFMAMLAGCTASMMVSSLSHGQEKVAVATASHSDRWAIKRLMGMGFTSLYNLKGGYSAWKRIHR